MQLEAYHVYGAIFIAYMVIKEVFVLVKGETREILKKVTGIEKGLSGIQTKVGVVNSRLDVLEDWHSKREVVFDTMLSRMDKLDDLWNWHNKEDSDGVRVWYIRTSLEKSLHKLSRVLDRQYEVLSSVVSKVNSLETDVKTLETDIEEIKEKL